MLFVESVMSAVPSAIFNGLKAGDAPFRAIHMARGIEESIVKEAKDAAKGLKGKEAKSAYNKKYKELRDNPTDKNVADGIDASDVGTFQSSNVLSSAVSKLKRDAWKNNEATGLVGEAVVPFVTTPTNIISAFLEYEPIYGFTKSAINRLNARGKKTIARGKSEKLLKDSHTAFGRASVGLVLEQMSDKIAESGVVTPDYDDARERELLSLSGKTPGSINLDALIRMLDGTAEYNKDGTVKFEDGDVQKSSKSFGVLGEKMSVAAKIHDQIKSGELDENDTAGIALRRAHSLLNQQLKKSFLTGVENITGALLADINDSDFDSKLSYTGGNFLNILSSPLAPRVFTKPILGTRDAKEERFTGQLSDMINNIELVRIFKGEEEANKRAKVDVFGNVVPNTPEGQNKLLYNTLETSNTTITKKNKLATELVDIMDTIPSDQRSKVIPSRVSRIDPRDKDRRLTPEEYSHREKLAGQRFVEGISELISTDGFDKFSAEEKADFIKKTKGKITRELNNQIKSGEIVLGSGSSEPDTTGSSALSEKGKQSVKAAYEAMLQRGDSPQQAQSSIQDKLQRDGKSTDLSFLE